MRSTSRRSGDELPELGTGQFRLHPVTEADWRSHRDLRLEMLADNPDAFWVTLDHVSHWTEQQWRDATSTAQHLQARDGDDVVLGTIGVLPRPYSPEVPWAEGAVNLIAMYVSPAARRRGVAASLMEGASALTRALGRHEMLLEVASNNKPAIRFYQRCGFTFTGYTTAHPRKADLVEREMSRLLPGPAAG